MRSNEFDPLAYIENAFLDKNKTAAKVAVKDSIEELDIPSLVDYVQKPNGKPEQANGHAAPAVLEPQERAQRFRKTVMSAPRPRRAKALVDEKVIDPELQECWETLPRSIEFLCSFYDDSVTANYYRGEFKESRKDLIRRLLDPELSLE